MRQEATRSGLRHVHREPIEKAARLVAEHRVSLQANARVYAVQGDSATYQVIASPDGITCPCPARTPLCSHVLAVAALGLSDTPPAPVTCPGCGTDVQARLAPGPHATAGYTLPLDAGGLCADCAWMGVEVAS